MTAVKRLGRSRLAALVGLTPSLRSVVLEWSVTTLLGLPPRLVVVFVLARRVVGGWWSSARSPRRVPSLADCRTLTMSTRCLCYCFYLTSYPRQRVLLIACNGASGRSPFPATKTLRAWQNRTAAGCATLVSLPA